MRIGVALTILLVFGFAQPVLAAPPDACKLLTPGDVQAVLGKGFAPAPGGVAADYSVCTYKRGAAEVAGVMVLGGSTSATENLKARARMLGSKATPVTGLGEGAFRVAKDTIAGVWFAKGAWQVNVEVRGGGTHATDAVQKLAATVFSRLP